MSTVNELLNYFVVNNDSNELIEDENQQKEKTVIKRYFPGKKPHYAKHKTAKGEEDEEENEDDEEEEDENEEENVDDHQFSQVFNVQLKENEDDKLKSQ
ncbi:hypothetical protein HEP_00519300, partial [Hepatocystis sp. ex Piliocolobus tephrosceles]